MIEDSLPFVYGEALQRSWWWKQDNCFHNQHWVPESNGSSNRVNSEDWGQPSIRFPWRSTSKVLMVEAGPLLPPSKLGTREQRHVFEGIESKFKLRHREFATNGSCVCLFHLWFQLQAHWLENLVSRRMIMYEWDKHQTVVALFHAAGGCRCPC